MLGFFDSMRQQSFAPAEQEKLDWLRLARTDNVGPITFYKLLDAFGSAGDALEALPQLAQRGGRKKPLRAPSPSHIEREYAALKKLGGDLITAQDPLYPVSLSALDDAPPVLSILGRPELLEGSHIAMVGARSASINGRKFATQVAQDLGHARQIVVSGLARGIDTAAHQGALKTGTIAVIATGIDQCYPEENQALFDQIAAEGLIISENPLGQKPYAQAFPKRNRIVSGLSRGVVVIEATMRSGSLITARMAGEQGRDLFAVPGHPLDGRAAGPNHLIKEGAHLVASADDILEILRDFSGSHMRDIQFEQKTFSPLKIEEDIPDTLRSDILSHLSFTPVTVDELIRTCDVNISAMQSVLLELELAGRVKRLPGGRITLLEE